MGMDIGLNNSRQKGDGFLQRELKPGHDDAAVSPVRAGQIHRGLTPKPKQSR